MAIRGEAARLLTYQSAWLLDAGQRNTTQAAYAKAFAADNPIRSPVNAPGPQVTTTALRSA